MVPHVRKSDGPDRNPGQQDGGDTRHGLPALRCRSWLVEPAQGLGKERGTRKVLSLQGVVELFSDPHQASSEPTSATLSLRRPRLMRDLTPAIEIPSETATWSSG